MKKFILIAIPMAILLAVLIGVGVFQTSAAAEAITVTIDTGASVTLTDADGDGYYEIDTADKIYAFAAAVNGGKTAINGELTADITVNNNVVANGALNTDANTVAAFRPWIPIASGGTYDGTFDGNGHTIKGLYYHTDGQGAGFVYVLNGTVKRLTLSESYMYAEDGHAGGIASNIYSGATVADCTYTGVVKTNEWPVGGIAGGITAVVQKDSKVENCENRATISGGNSLGGIAGYCYGEIIACYNAGSIVSNRIFVGGIVGVLSQGTVLNCGNVGSVTGATNYGSPSGVGGVVGSVELDPSVVANCYNAGALTGTEPGSILGNLRGSVYNCFYNEDKSAYPWRPDADATEFSATTGLFVSGAVCYGLSLGCTVGEGSDATTYAGDVWGQDLKTSLEDADYELTPRPGSKKVYEGYTTDSYCDDYKIGYGNEERLSELGHHWDNGICTACNVQQEATKGEDGIYRIANAGQLLWFANNACIISSEVRNSHAMLTADIDLNPGYTFTFLLDTGVVEVTGPSGLVGYLGTNAFGKAIDDGNTVFDEVPSGIGSWYADTADAVPDDIGEDPLRYWATIGYDLASFTGVFDGNGHTIYGLVKTEDISHVGLFYTVSGDAVIKNVNIGRSCLLGANHLGGIAAEVQEGALVENCRVDAIISGYQHAIGGIAGINAGTVRSCFSIGTVIADSSSGGIVGENSGSVVNCGSTGALVPRTSMGGVVGENSGTVANCYYAGAVLQNATTVGSVVAVNTGTVTKCYYLDRDDLLGIGSGEGETIPKSESAFRSGEVAYLLNGSVSVGTLPFGQTLSGASKNPTPVRKTDANTVYYGYISCAPDAQRVYSNLALTCDTIPDHADAANDSDHICDYGCGAVLEACTDAETDDDHSCDICGKQNVSAHIYGDWTVTKESTATEKGSRTKACACGHTLTEEMSLLAGPTAPSDADSLPVGAVVGIVIGTAVLLGGGGFALYWFVIRKRKWSDLAGIFKKK